jgi:integrase/recombinase XerC
MNLSEMIAQFVLAKEVEEGCSPNTVKAYRYDLKMFMTDIGDISVESIRIIHVRKFLNTIHEKNYTKQGVGRKIACLKSFFQFCLDNEIIEKNPMNNIKSPKIRPEEALPKFLSHEDIDLIFTAIESQKGFTAAWRSRMAVLIRLMYASMARISEICNLKLQDVDFDHNIIKVRGKGNKERFIPIDAETALQLHLHYADRLLETNKLDDPLFVNLRGQKIQPRSVERDLQALKGQLGFSEDKKFTPHVFRHTGATHLRQNGMDISELQDLLGHANPNTTRIYAKNDMNRLTQSYLQYHPLAKK